MFDVSCKFCPNPFFLIGCWGPIKGKILNPVLCIYVPDGSLYIICVFYSSRIRTLVAMVTLSFHKLIMGKVEISYFLKTIAA